jgi:hypothetical protein
LANPAQAPAAYTPNLKFKVMDKEHSIDEFLKGAIKDAETEKKVKELYEKAYGLDIVKPRFQETRQELSQWKKGAQELKTHYERGDFDSFFQTLGVPEEKILQWVYDKLNYNELPPEQRQMIEREKSAQQRAWEAEQRAQEMQQQYEGQVSNAKVYALETALKLPDVTKFAQTFEAAYGEGTFRDAIIDEADFALMKSNGKVDLTPEQAIQRTMQKYRHLGGAASPAAPAAQPGQPGVVPAQSAQPGVIPNVSGRSASPTKPKARNIEDLKKLAASMS